MMQSTFSSPSSKHSCDTENTVASMVKPGKREKAQHLFLPTEQVFSLLLFKHSKSWTAGSKCSEVFKNYFPSVACNSAHSTSCHCGTLIPGWREELEAVACKSSFMGLNNTSDRYTSSSFPISLQCWQEKGGCCKLRCGALQRQNPFNSLCSFVQLLFQKQDCLKTQILPLKPTVPWLEHQCLFWTKLCFQSCQELQQLKTQVF